jgi:DNA-binding PadR family transcriptional regulator
MALEHAILVSLAERSASGYDLARRFDASIGHFWKATHQQIYRVLGRMESDKLVESHLVAQDGRPDKKVYSITDSGRDELTNWLAQPSPDEGLRSTFAVKLRAQHLADRETLIADVRRRREAHAATLAHYRASEAKFFPEPSAIADEHLGGWLALRGGIRVEQGGIEWCDEILEALERRQGAVT